MKANETITNIKAEGSAWVLAARDEFGSAFVICMRYGRLLGAGCSRRVLIDSDRLLGAG